MHCTVTKSLIRLNKYNKAKNSNSICVIGQWSVSYICLLIKMQGLAPYCLSPDLTILLITLLIIFASHIYQHLYFRGFVCYIIYPFTHNAGTYFTDQMYRHFSTDRYPVPCVSNLKPGLCFTGLMSVYYISMYGNYIKQALHKTHLDVHYTVANVCKNGCCLLFQG